MDTVTTPSLPFDDSVSMLAGSSPNEASLKLFFFFKNHQQNAYFHCFRNWWP